MVFYYEHQSTGKTNKVYIISLWYRKKDVSPPRQTRDSLGHRDQNRVLNDGFNYALFLRYHTTIMQIKTRPRG